MQNIIPLMMFVALVTTIIIGIPIAFATGIVALIFSYFLWGSSSIFALLTAITATMDNWVLLAVPLFTFMSMVLYEANVVEDLYNAFYKWSGSLRGGLAIASISVGTIMGAMTGVAAGTVVSLGTIALPQMLKYKYDKKIAMGSILAGGTLGQLVPPSTIMIVYGAMTGVSVGGLFAGGLGCGILLSAMYCIYVLIISYFNRELCPALSPDERVSLKEKFISLKGVVLPVILILGVLGSIFTGIATPTEAAAVGSTGALICALTKKRLSWKVLKKASLSTLRLTSMVAWITIGALYFGQVFTAVGGRKLILQLFTTIPLGNFGALVLTMGILFFLGMFLDTIAIVVICAPIFSGIVTSLGFDPLWFGLLFMVNLQAAYLTPPFGYSLFYLKGVTPKNISMADIYKSSLPFVGLQIFGLTLLILFPKLALWSVEIFMK